MVHNSFEVTVVSKICNTFCHGFHENGHMVGRCESWHSLTSAKSSYICKSPNRIIVLMETVAALIEKTCRYKKKETISFTVVYCQEYWMDAKMVSLCLESILKLGRKVISPVRLPHDFGQPRKHHRKWIQHKDKVSFCTHFTVSDTNFDSCFIQTVLQYISHFSALKLFIPLLKHSNNLYTKKNSNEKIPILITSKH